VERRHFELWGKRNLVCGISFLENAFVSSLDFDLGFVFESGFEIEFGFELAIGVESGFEMVIGIESGFEMAIGVDSGFEMVIETDLYLEVAFEFWGPLLLKLLCGHPNNRSKICLGKKPSTSNTENSKISSKTKLPPSNRYSKQIHT